MEKQINLLLVDDEEHFLEAIKKRLEFRGFNVIAVNSGERALEVAKTSSVDVAVVDLRMPGMSGEETLAALKKQHEWLEVVILTGHGTTDSAIDCTKSGAYYYLHKPCELDHFLDILRQAYQKRVMNKRKIEEKKMQEFLSLVDSSSPLSLLKKIKEIDEKS